MSVNHEPGRLEGAAAHEFGHALGIKAHSPYREDLMYVDRVVNDLSEGDKATLRLLYRAKTPYLM
ncbi:MAG: matrixin family metalloprotease [Cyanobacteriota/Melainabacteria group bacterium]